MKKPKIALALGAGGARGLAHVGILKVFQEHNIPIDMIAGSSMGAIVGGLYCAGVPLDYFSNLVKKTKRRDIVDLGFSKCNHGIVKGNRAEKYFRKILKETNAVSTIENCKIPFGCVSMDILTGKVHEFTSGDLAKTIRGSYSMGGIFNPVPMDGMLLVDAGPLCRVPVNLARKMGADIVIAVDCVGETMAVERKNIKGIKNTAIRMFSIMEYASSKYEINTADILIQVFQPEVEILELKQTMKAIKNGKKVAESSIERIKTEIDKWIKKHN